MALDLVKVENTIQKQITAVIGTGAAMHGEQDWPRLLPHTLLPHGEERSLPSLPGKRGREGRGRAWNHGPTAWPRPYRILRDASLRDAPQDEESGASLFPATQHHSSSIKKPGAVLRAGHKSPV